MRGSASGRGVELRRSRSSGSLLDSLAYSMESVMDAAVVGEDKEIQICMPKVECKEVETQTDFPRDLAPGVPAKPPLMPGALAAEDSARTMSAMHATLKRGRTNLWPLEGLWTMMGSHQSQATDSMLRLHFHHDSLVDNMGAQLSLTRLAKYAFLGDGVLSLEGPNLLHRDTVTGQRFTYTRGEGGFQLGAPVQRDGLHLDFAGLLRHASAEKKDESRSASLSTTTRTSGELRTTGSPSSSRSLPPQRRAQTS